ncbi:hypothetical protein XENOCAPTIV_009639, partial [Xenoophorus captivus]
LIDYLEGRITFEEFDRRRDECKTELAEMEENKVMQTSGAGSTHKDGVSLGVQQAFASILGETVEEASSEDEDSLSYVDDQDDRDYNGEEAEEAKDMTKETKRRPRQGVKKVGKRSLKSKLEEEEADEENMTVGDVFKLEMELNRENRKLMKGRRHGSKLPQALRGLMGEANIRYARGEKEDAILMCMEIIRQSPLAYEPFSTLAMIYEDNGDVDKALQFGLIAAHLNPSDCEEWIRLAEMSLEQDNIRQAIICYTKAIKYDPTNVRYLWDRSSLHMRLGEHKQCMDGYRKILSLLPLEDGEHFMQLSKDMAKSYYESNDLPSALSVIAEGLARHPSLVSDDFINMAAELYICSRQYKEALQVHICVSVHGAFGGCSFPQGLVLSLMEQSPEEIGDLYLDVAEAYLEQGRYSSALPLLSALVVSEKYDLAVVWLRHAECLKALGHMKEAAESYTKVVEMAPLHLEARLSLATVQQQLGRMDCALKALESMYDSDTLAQDSSAAQKVRPCSMSLGKTNVLSKEDWWQLLLSCLLGLCEVERYEEADLLVESAMEFYSFYDSKPMRKELEFIGLSATFLNHDYFKAYNYMRFRWRIKSRLTTSSQHQRHHRFCLRLLLKHPDNHALCVVCGHNAMVSGSFKHALGIQHHA